MKAQWVHQPVMLAEVLTHLSPIADQTFIDATFGAGGYTQALLQQGAKHVAVIDRDPRAIEHAKLLQKEVGEARLSIHHGAFADVLQQWPAANKVDGVVFDLGVSSPQLDHAERGFSYAADGPLDMRMDTTRGVTAADVVNTTKEAELADLIYLYGEERKSRAVARAICQQRVKQPFATTQQLANCIAKVVRRAADGIHPATRTFQALRIAVNDELRQIELALPAAAACLAVGGRLVVVSFHSLEDRLVKQYLSGQEPDAEPTSRHLPMMLRAAAKTTSPWQILTRKPLVAGDEELHRNSRARSAKMRAAVKLNEDAT